MEFGDLVRSRRMTRDFDPTPLPAELLSELLEGALCAPSAGFSEGIDLLVLTAPESRAHFWRLIGDASWRESTAGSVRLMAAPCIIVPFGDPRAYVERYRREDKQGSSLAGRAEDSWPVPYWIVDAAFVAMSLLLGVSDAGLGALFFQLQGKERELRAGFGVPTRLLPIGALAIGYGASTTADIRTTRRRRRNVTEIIHTEHW